jgi:hypothetical protein
MTCGAHISSTSFFLLALTNSGKAVTQSRGGDGGTDQPVGGVFARGLVGSNADADGVREGQPTVPNQQRRWPGQRAALGQGATEEEDPPCWWPEQRRTMTGTKGRRRGPAPGMVATGEDCRWEGHVTGREASRWRRQEVPCARGRRETKGKNR